jgi:SAM-dependent methyltransferase
VQERFLKQLYEQTDARALTPQEQYRIASTHELIPARWQSILDVGCGDGRLSNPLVERGVQVTGVDWSESRLGYCNFPTLCGDITKLDLPDKSFDGAICAEVIEHLQPSKIAPVIAAMKRLTQQGFVITVPAYERLSLRLNVCAQCRKPYHIWGHINAYHSVEDVDKAVGQPSVQRKFIRTAAFEDPIIINQLRRDLGWYPYAEDSVCPYCGLKLAPPPTLTGVKRLLYRGLTAISFATCKVLRRQYGWFACRYSS